MMLRSTRLLRDFLGERCVLVIEPSLNYKNSIRSFLTNLKVQNIKIVGSVAEARREILSLKVGLFICEWIMADTNGIQFCKEVRTIKKHAETPFLLTTVENLRSDVILASEVGIDAYLLKPFSYEDFVEAVENIVKTRVSPKEVNQFLTQGFEKLDENSLDDAENLFLLAQAESPLSARACCGMARIAVLRGKVADSIKFYRQAIQYNPDFIDAYRELAEILKTQHKTKELHEICIKLNELSPDNPKYTLLLAKTYLEMKDAAQAEKFFKKTIRYSPKLAEAYKGLGKVNMIQEDYASAMKNFRKALDLDTKDVSVLNSLGLTYIKMGRYEEGIDRYRMALRINPHDSRILFNLGIAMEKVGNKTQAAFYYRQAITYQPSFDKAKRRLASMEGAVERKMTFIDDEEEDNEVA